ncbi:Elongation factor 1-gamma 2 [Zea mays]|uniref:Elongation factor 1-gamma 2 n=1 Tax=Zea mays TaxID=4577 RepID=A0A3L6E6H8_MAIZE|nr:Elongation factor 1-gamma 2 [Zea mays]
MALVLHSGAGNKNAFKALIAAEYSGIKVELTKDFEMGVSNKTPEFLKMNPLGKVPVLETPDGPVFESNAIARYVARLKDDNPLFGSSRIEQAHVEQWMDFAATEVDPGVAWYLYPRLGYLPYVSTTEETAISSLKRSLGALNTHLASNTYLVGHAVTLADIVLTCNLYHGIARILTKTFTSDFPHVERYFWTMVNQPNFKKVIGEVKQAESAPPIPKKVAPSKEPKAKDVKKEAPKEATKPKVVEAPAEEEAPKPKPKNPLDLLPPSKMVLDDWKRLYSNTKTNFREVAIKGFWDMYDPEGYSLWFCDYKYNDENTVSFVTLNKVGGFLQRMDLCRKYAFGKMLVIGSEPPFKLKGLWLFRGQDVPKFVMDEVYDMELYEWTKVDISDEAQKERVNAMIEDQEPFEGEALLDAKCFK